MAFVAEGMASDSPGPPPSPIRSDWSGGGDGVGGGGHGVPHRWIRAEGTEATTAPCVVAVEGAEIPLAVRKLKGILDERTKAEIYHAPLPVLRRCGASRRTSSRGCGASR